MNKKVCFVVTDAVSFNVLMRGSLEHLSSYSDFELTLICGGKEGDIDALEARNVGRVIRVPMVRKPRFFLDVRCLFKLAIFFKRNKFDLVVYSTPKAMLLCSLASFFFQPKRLALFRGRAYERYSGLKYFVYSKLDKLLFKLSSHCCSISMELKRNLCKDLMIPTDHISVVGKGSSNGVDVGKFCPPSEELKWQLRRQYGLNPEQFVVLVAGRLCRDKGIEDVSMLIERFGFKNFKFLVVGLVDDEFGTEFLKRYRTNESVIILEHTDNISELFKLSDVHLFLSRREGFGNVAIEAAASGVPTVAYDISGLRDSVSNGLSGYLIEPFSVDLVERKLRELYEQVLSGQSPLPVNTIRNWAVSNYDSTVVWENYRKYYEEIARE